MVTAYIFSDMRALDFSRLAGPLVATRIGREVVQFRSDPEVIALDVTGIDFSGADPRGLPIFGKAMEFTFAMVDTPVAVTVSGIAMRLGDLTALLPTLSPQGFVNAFFSGDDVLMGNLYADYVLAGSGADSILGGDANDTLFGQTGNDTIQGDHGLDFIRGEEGDDSLFGGADFDDLHGNQGNDTVRGGDGADWVVGGQGNDLLLGEAGDDVVYGNLGADTQDGGDGRDWVRGGQADDSLAGGAGDDWMSGDLGDDTISGGPGADIFHTWGAAGIDLITDFNRAQGDRVQLDAGTVATTSQVGADTVIDMVGGGKMILVGVSMATLSGDWIFAG